MESEANKLPKGPVLGRDENIHIRHKGSTPLDDVGSNIRCVETLSNGCNLAHIKSLTVHFGDLHGDLGQTRCALETAGVLSPDGEDVWTGGETVLIQLGDILDRGEDEIAILSLLRSLDIQAKAESGAVFQLVILTVFSVMLDVNGNHQTINMEGEFRFMDAGGFDECLDFLDYLDDNRDDWEEAFVGWVGQKQKDVIARSILLRPGGPLACELARHAVVLKKKLIYFLFASPDRSIDPSTLAYGVERMNREINYILQQTLQAVGAKGMVVGHTPQPTGANCEYDCSMWRIDVGMSSGVLNSRPEVNLSSAASVHYCQMLVS
ncbi:hypothetical protein D8674_023245 [Pyrus ussuriensis x Pyrus communis]|uniref:Calcineurin-like phosphoesterase domain-containing protein n=1 Tax=Pyrus ussuriensis x Pyrus communis TaxID=2448454 RepID=A0A5N5GNE4_9ROSA|nr:hypothetical protein D8674_023245 [Pyrus ussuriensis x Pyrus communis]